MDLIVISLKISLFSPWYSWKIAELALSNTHTLTLEDIATTALNKLLLITSFILLTRSMHGNLHTRHSHLWSVSMTSLVFICSITRRIHLCVCCTPQLSHVFLFTYSGVPASVKRSNNKSSLYIWRKETNMGWCQYRKSM